MIEAPAALLLWFLFGSRGRSTSPPNGRGGVVPAGEVYPEGVWPRAVPKGGEVAIKLTGGPDPAAWRQSRYQACVDFLMQDDRSLDAMTLLFEQQIIERGDVAIDGVALSVVAHWDIETASGAHEYNFNVGGIAAVPGQQHFISTDVGDPKTKVAFCAYDSLQEGIADYFGVLSYDRYVRALAPLLMLPSDPEWFSELGWGGYYGMDPVQAAAVLAARRTLIAIDTGQGPEE
jgi:hypothetical protein